MAITMYKGKDSKVVHNRDVRQHRREGWTFDKPSTKTVLQKKITKKKPKAKLEVEPEVIQVEPKTITDLPGPEDLNLLNKEY